MDYDLNKNVFKFFKPFFKSFLEKHSCVHPLSMHCAYTFLKNYLRNLLPRICKLMFTALKSKQRKTACKSLIVPPFANTNTPQHRKAFGWLLWLSEEWGVGRGGWGCLANTHARSHSPPCWCYYDGCRCCWTPLGKWRRAAGRWRSLTTGRCP